MNISVGVSPLLISVLVDTNVVPHTHTMHNASR